MRILSGVLVVWSVLIGSATAVLARCGDDPADGRAVAAVSPAVAARCGCCGQRIGTRTVACILPTVRAAMRAGQLPRRCLGRAVRAARRACPAVCPPPPTTGRCFDTIQLACTGVDCSPERPCPLPNAFCDPRCAEPPPVTTTTLPGGKCGSDADCDDGNPCSHDACVDGTCVHECLCVSPLGGGLTCCPGPAAACPPPVTTTSTTLGPCGAGCQYFYTCGWPVCPFPPIPRSGVPPCTTQRAGEPCPTRGATCDPAADCGQLLLCTDSDPTTHGCPISQRRYKQDISYLGDKDVARLRDKLLKLRLATYRYKTERDGGPDHLGFIIDDVGRSPAVNADGTTVDLYGYASMAVAAIQAQAREIEALRSEVAVLRRQLRQSAPAPVPPTP